MVLYHPTKYRIAFKAVVLPHTKSLTITWFDLVETSKGLLTTWITRSCTALSAACQTGVPSVSRSALIVGETITITNTVPIGRIRIRGGNQSATSETVSRISNETFCGYIVMTTCTGNLTRKSPKSIPTEIEVPVYQSRWSYGSPITSSTTTMRIGISFC